MRVPSQSVEEDVQALYGGVTSHALLGALSLYPFF